MTLEEIIRQRLAEATEQVTEAKKIADLKDPVGAEEVGCADEVETDPKLGKGKMKLTKESLDEMTQEEFDSIDEEQLDELSKATLQSYVSSKKAGGPLPADKDERKVRLSGLTKAHDKLKTTKESTSEQVSALLEAEGLSTDFKEQAVTIFEAAVTDRVLQIEEGLKQEFDKQLAEAKEELNNDIDGFLSEAIQQWKQENEVAIKSNFKSQVAESFIDGMKALIAEHNIEVPEDKEDALATALSEVDKLNESIVDQKTQVSGLQEQVNELKASNILESFKEKMTNTEFDRFTQLTESVKFKDEVQYTKQLSVVLENFGSTKAKSLVEEQVETISVNVPGAINLVSESNTDMAAYTKYITKARK